MRLRSGKKLATYLARKRLLSRVYALSASRRLDSARHDESACDNISVRCSTVTMRKATYVNGDDALSGRLSSTNACRRCKRRARFENVALVPRCQTAPAGARGHRRKAPPSERWRNTAQYLMTRPCRQRAQAQASTLVVEGIGEGLMWTHAG